MLKSGKSVVILVALMVIIGICAHLAQKKTPPFSPPPTNTQNAPSTKHPYLHSNHPSATEPQTPEDPNPGALSKITREKVEEYLRLHNRNAASLLAAFHALGDTNYLNEVATCFPNDPRVQWTLLARNSFPEDRRKWLDNFKTSSPGNSLANYLSAQDYFKNNQPDAAMKELLTASAKSQFKDYSMDTVLDAEELGRFAGTPPFITLDSSMTGMAGDLFPELANFKGIAAGIRDLQQQYANAGDTASVQNLAQMGLGLAEHLTSSDDGKFIMKQLVGMALEASILDSLDKNTPCDFLGGQTPAQRLAELKQQKSSILELTQNQTTLLLNANKNQIENFGERIKIYGELEAVRWLQQQNLATPNSGN